MANLIAQAKTITGATNLQIAKLLGIGESTAQAYDGGRLPERLTEKQIDALLAAVRGYRDTVIAGVAAMELLA